MRVANGYCAGRFTCKNLNTKLCQPVADNDIVMECENYKKR